MHFEVTVGDRIHKCPVRISAKARYLQIRFIPDKGLELVLPRFASYADAEKFLKKNIDWVEKKLKSANHPRDTHNHFHFLGKPFSIKTTVTPKGQSSYKITGDSLEISHPEPARINYSKLFDLIYKIEGKKILPIITNEIASEFGFTPNRITVRGQSSRWGSCSRKGNINLNFRMMKFRREIINYIIIHELCHLRHFDHSKAFWTEVSKHSPNYKLLKKEIKNF